MKIVPLWSDALLILLLALVVAGAWWSRKQAHLKDAWRKVGASGTAMAAATVLAAFVVVGVLDSLHYRPALPAKGDGPVQYSNEVLSVLDALLLPLKSRSEKTYSAPLATHLFAKESLDGEGRDFPRLKHGGVHLGQDLAAQDGDIAMRVLTGLGLGVALWLPLWFWVRKRKIGAGDTAMGSVLGTAFVMLLVAGPVALLSAGYHVLGTDKVGQDVLYLTLKSIRTGLLIGTLTTLIMLPAAVLLGILAGYVGGWVDDLIQYLYTVLNSIPGVLLIAAAVLMMQVIIDTHPEWFATSAERADARLLALCLILGVTSWTGLARLLRGETLKLREMDYVQAARAFGVGRLAIMLRHILPNLMHIVLIALVMDFSGLVLAEAVLSYVGIGVDPNTISFGTMINAARMELAREPMVWWSLAAAFAFMFALVLAANLFADAVRDAFDPRAVK
ncbi:ABC transporter permease [Sulfurisoma sediminicola]|uniref:Peptide/nickel transport system permease protein n=1 Tax=Sulfurisoma sediminicola TaxID=1381557 RepID=A0A497XFB3_9PROT|nr:ABC transporter permease [Sulfurisoma sediminicola]RLJ65359.1 peptide/nickel transport system permease protein [Sulfurisoma sediminicola]